MVPTSTIQAGRTMKKTTRPDSEARDRILGAAWKAFAEDGYANTSTLEIATRAKVSKRDLYANFPSKQAILLTCIAERTARMRLPPDFPGEPGLAEGPVDLRPRRTPQRRASKRGARLDRNRDMLEASLAKFGAAVLREASQPEVVAMFRLAIAEAEHAPEVAKTLNQGRMAARDRVTRMLADAQSAGFLATGDPEAMTEQFFALLWGDLMLGRLLHLAKVPKPAGIEKKARQAAQAFMKLYPR
jgi:AcrR family transcriptional regulator